MFPLCHVTAHIRCGTYLMEKCLSWGAACCNRRHWFPRSLICRSTCTGLRKSSDGLSEQCLQQFPTPIPNLSQEQREPGQELCAHRSHWAVGRTGPTWGEELSLQLLSVGCQSSTINSTPFLWANFILSPEGYHFSNLRLKYGLLQFYFPSQVENDFSDAVCPCPRSQIVFYL